MTFPPFAELSKTIVSILKQRGGSATTTDISKELIKRFRMGVDAEMAKAPSGESAWKSRLRNTKSAMLKHEMLVPAEPGIWKLAGK